MAKILVVDDEECVLNTLTNQLKTYNHNVVTALDTECAFKLLNKQKFDVIITDVRMPGNGLPYLEKLRKLTPNTGKIVLTGYNDDFPTILKYNDFYRLQKPHTIEDLLVLIERACLVDPLESIKQIITNQNTSNVIIDNGFIGVFLKKSTDMAIIDCTIIKDIYYKKHVHEDSDCYISLYQGSLMLFLDKTTTVYNAPSFFHIPKNHEHYLELKAGARYIVTIAPYVEFSDTGVFYGR